jgi:hypothetical protein
VGQDRKESQIHCRENKEYKCGIYQHLLEAQQAMDEQEAQEHELSASSGSDGM